MTSRKGLAAHDYHVLHVLAGAPAIPETPATDAWGIILEEVVDELVEGLRELVSSGIPIPDDVGGEMTDEQGRIYAEAELVWNETRVALLRPDQSEFEQHLKDEGWKVVVAENDWTTALNTIFNG